MVENGDRSSIGEVSRGAAAERRVGVATEEGVEASGLEKGRSGVVEEEGDV